MDTPLLPTPVKPKHLQRADHGPASIAKAEKIRDALQMRRQGMQYPEIAKKLGITIVAAQKIVRDAIKEIPEEAASDMRAIEGARFDDMEERTRKQLDAYEAEVELFRSSNGLDGKCPANSIFIELQEHLLQISAARRKMFGIDAALKVEGSGVALVGIAELMAARNINEDPPDDPCPPPKTLTP